MRVVATQHWCLSAARHLGGAHSVSAFQRIGEAASRLEATTWSGQTESVPRSHRQGDRLDNFAAILGEHLARREGRSVKSLDGVVIVGAGLAGARAAEALRQQGFTGRVTLLGEEPERPYLRPPLSKDYLRGRWERDKVFVHSTGWYDENDIELRLRTRVVRIDRDRHEVHPAFGGPIRYDKLLLATGAAPRMLQIPGANPHRVVYLRRIEDSMQLRAMWGAGARKVAIVGAGWIGLEVAAAARQAGLQVTVLEAAELPLLSVLGREAGQLFADLHSRHGVDVRCGVHVKEVTGADPRRASGVRLADGTEIEADLVIAGVGAVPRVELARDAGLTIDDGIRVDEQLRSIDDSDIYAVGDVASAYHPVLGRYLRVAHWATAHRQPQVAVSAMLGGDAVYDRLPYFYSDQYELGMEYYGYVGQPDGCDEVVFRRERKEVIVFWVKGHRVLAAMNVNVWDQTQALRALVRNARPVDAGRLADSRIPLEDLVPGQGVRPG